MLTLSLKLTLISILCIYAVYYIDTRLIDRWLVKHIEPVLIGWVIVTIVSLVFNLAQLIWDL